MGNRIEEEKEYVPTLYPPSHSPSPSHRLHSSRYNAAVTLNLTQSWAQLGGLMFVARRLVDGLYAGRHLSRQVGVGQDFHDYRPYAPGDSLNDLDWKLLGRTDRLYVRRYRRQTDLPVHVVVDASASMQFSGLDADGRPIKTEHTPTKFQMASLLAAAVAFLVTRQSDRVGLSLFADRLLKHLPAAATMSHLKQFCTLLEQSTPEAGMGRLKESLHQTHRLMRRRGMLILLSDLLDDPSELFDGLAPFSHAGWEVIVLQTLTPQELDISLLSGQRLQLVDAETRMTLPTSPSEVSQAYQQRFDEHLTTIAQGCAARRFDHQLVTNEQSIPEALRRYLARRASVRM